MQEVWKQFMKRPTKLWIKIGESFGNTERLDVDTHVQNSGKKWKAAKKGVHQIDGVMHMGSYVQQMLKERLEWLKQQQQGRVMEMETE
ncbi:hypothetical protein HK096_007183 [Nowakowskiella sp. JEL0078]|nr:hypothetical protein HK096_007183 [Nowakowskiella sp. JEL0078]